LDKTSYYLRLAGGAMHRRNGKNVTATWQPKQRSRPNGGIDGGRLRALLNPVCQDNSIVD
jgi:hypothetical protein